MGSFVVFAALVAAVALLGGRFRPGAWYASLRKPIWTPPAAVFPPVWALLYLAIATAGWLLWRSPEGAVGALLAWALQLVANGLWSWLFFGLRRAGLAFADIVALLCFIAAFIVLALPQHPAAALLFVPYLLWVAFAAALNYRIWRLNREVAA